MQILFLCQSDRFLQVYPPQLRQRLCALGACKRIYTAEQLDQTPDAFGDVTDIFSTWGMPPLSSAQIRRFFPRLRRVFYAAGSVQQFARPFLACGVRVFSAWGANAVPVAEYTVSQIVLANAGFFAAAALQSAGKTQQAGKVKAQYPGNYGAKVGLLGLGMIGRRVADMLRAYALEVLACDPFLPQETADALGVRPASLTEIFQTCQVVSNHMANNEQTRGMLGYDLFAGMPPYATFLNTGRGAQVVEADLVRALTERPDLYAVLDVTWPEPPAPGHPFYTLPNAVLTPHIAGSKGDEVHRMAQYMFDEYQRVIRGQPAQWEVTLPMLETMA
jgi:phosphoglycerate dehydrogenase-like enzyme